MRQKEKMYNEGGAGVGGGAIRPENERKDNSKFLFFAIAVVIIAAGIILAIINA